MTLNKQLDELLISATESDNQKILSDIISTLATRKEPITKNIKDGLSMIIESWQADPDNSPNKTRFLIEVTQFFNERFQELRSVLPAVVKKTLPIGINKTTTIKVLKIRDANTLLAKFYFHYKNLIELKPDRFFYNTNSGNWGITGKIDWITGTIILLKLNGTKLREVELPVIIDQICIFDSKIELNNLLKTPKLPSSKELINTLTDNAYTSIKNDIIKKSLFAIFVPEKMKLAAFDKWWNDSTNESTPVSSDKTSIENCRSISELNIFVRNTPSCSITEDNITKLTTLFNTIKPTSSVKDYTHWVETISLISSKLTLEQIQSILPKNDKITRTIWPDLSEEAANFIWIDIWCQLKAGLLPSWANITDIVKGSDYLKELCLYVPWRCWKAITSNLEVEDLEKELISAPRLSNPEALLWVWRNRQKLSNILLAKLNHTTFLSSLSRKVNIAIWEEAKKELKKLIQDNADFQSHILKKDDEAVILDFLEKLNHSMSFTTSEKQSLIVKLSRKYPILKKIFESGKAKKMIPSASKDELQQPKQEIHLTSIKSFNEKIAELHDIINVQVPENTKAIATARAHGDLRENAEYAAAKERQKYLNEHRAMIEIGIATTQPTDFSDIEVSDRIIAGSTIHLKHDNNQIDIYHILGAWDSNPKKNYISYETKLGKAIIRKKVGDTVKLPGNITCTVEKITPLSEEIRKDLVPQKLTNLG